MKRLLIMLLVCTVLFALCACVDKEDQKAPENAVTEETNTEEPLTDSAAGSNQDAEKAPERNPNQGDGTTPGSATSKAPGTTSKSAENSTTSTPTTTTEKTSTTTAKPSTTPTTTTKKPTTSTQKPITTPTTTSKKPTNTTKGTSPIIPNQPGGSAATDFGGISIL